MIGKRNIYIFVLFLVLLSCLKEKEEVKEITSGIIVEKAYIKEHIIMANKIPISFAAKYKIRIKIKNNCYEKSRWICVNEKQYKEYEIGNHYGR